MKLRSFRLALIFAVAVGIFMGLGIFTFGYGKGLSYFSRDPAACANCHIMQEQYASWQHAPHPTAAACID